MRCNEEPGLSRLSSGKVKESEDEYVKIRRNSLEKKNHHM